MADDPVLSSDERAAVRAYLQRVEVRLSTLHRVATALLSGAGLVVLLPTIERDSVVVVLRSLLRDLSAANALLAASMVVVVALPLAALWLLLRELTRFYFHAQHVTAASSGGASSAGGVTGSVFVPRFTLTGLRLPRGELGPESAAALDAERASPANVELLVPAKAHTRTRIDRQLAAYEGLGSADVRGQQDPVVADPARARGLSELVASRDRTLLEEVAKVEYGLVRHLLRLQAIVLRYVKALLAFVTTAVAVFAAAAIVGDIAEPPGPAAQVALGIVVMVWAPCIVVVVATPVRWVEQLLRSEGATRASVSRDPELTQVEQLAIRIASLGWLVAAAATVLVVADATPSTTARILGVAAVAVTGAVHLSVTWSWLGRHRAGPAPAT